MTITNSIFNGSSGSSNFSVTPLTASTVLPAATGSGVTYIYEVGSASPINLTSTTSTVGGVATFDASNHGAGAKLLVNDSAIGQWDVSEVGAPASRTLARYSVRGVVDNVNLVNGVNILPIGSLVNGDLKASGMLMANENDPLGWRTANQITVSKSGRYKVDLNVVHTAGSIVGANAQVTSGTDSSGIRINGTSVEWVAVDDSTGLADQLAGFVIRQFTAGDQIDVVVNATSVETNEDFYVSFSMEELPVTEVVQAGTVVPTSLAFSHARASTAQTVADSTNVLVTIDTTIIDSSGIFVAGTNRIVAATAGLYRIRGVVPWSTSGNPGIQAATILVNGVAVKSSSTRNNQPLAMTQVETTLLLAAGDYVQLRARQETGASLSTIITSTSLTNVYPELEVRQLPNSSVVNPEDVPVVDLDYVSYATTTIGGTLSTELISGHYYPQLDNLNWTHKVDTNALLTLAAPPTGDSFTIKKAGLYAISVEMVANSYAEQTVYIFKNGTIVATGWANTGVGTSAMSQVGADVTLTLSVGDRIQFGSLIAAGWTASFSIRQLPSHSIVKYTPGDVVATTLNKFEARKDGGSPQSIPSGIDTDILFTSLTASEGSGYNTSTSTFTAPTAGWYSFDTHVRMDYNTAAIPQEMFIAFKVNGIEKGRGAFTFSGNSGNGTSYHYAQASVSVPLAIGDTVKVQCRQDTGLARPINNAASLNYFTGVQTATTSVVSPSAVPVQTLARARVGGGTGALASTVETQLAFSNTIYDVGLGVVGNTYVVPSTGLYRVSAEGLISSGTLGANASQYLRLYKNGVMVEESSNESSGSDGLYLALHRTLNFVAGDVLTIRVALNGTSASFSYGPGTPYTGGIEFTQLPSHSIVSYTPGDVVVENLDHLFLYEGNNLSVVQTFSGVVAQTGPDTLAVTGSRLDLSTPSSSNTLGITATGSTVTITKAGRYIVDASINCYFTVGGTTRLWWQLVKNGSTVLSTTAVSDNSANITNSHNIVWSGTLAATDTLDLRVGVQGAGDVNVQNYSLRVEQMPVGMLVDPGTVPVTNLKNTVATRTTTDFTISGSGIDVIFNTSVGGTIPYNTATGVFTLTAGEEYQLYASMKTRGTAAGYVQYEWVDAVSNAVLSGSVQGLDIHAPSVLIEGSSPAAQVPSYIPSTNQTVKVRVTGAAGTGLSADQTRCIAYVRQLATQTIINPLATTTNDQAASGYVDIGTMRVQFFTANVQNATAVTLPAPFANTNYRVTASVTSLSGVSYGGAQSKTTTGFQAIAVLSGSAYTSGLAAVDYIAVGLKP